MTNNKLHLHTNGYDLLESYTKELYGVRGTFHHNLQRYINSQAFRSTCRKVTNINDIPEITFTQILQLIDIDQHFNDLATHVISTFDIFSKERKMDSREYLNCAGVLGLCPSIVDDCDVLFPHLVDFSTSSEEENNIIINNITEKSNIVSAMVDTMLSSLRDHHMIEVKGHIVNSQGYSRNYYRGESAYYGQSRPSIYRKLPENKMNKQLYMVINYIRIIDFSLWLNQLSFVRNWPYGDVFHGAIAQHYGIPTNGMDVTSNLKTALFFACCCYENNKWRPLRVDEFEKTNSRDLGPNGDARYGIIYCAPVDISNMSKTANISNLRFTYATPIGYQPFMRCASQSGYMIEAAEQYNMLQDESFQKVKFRLSEEICNWIFKEMKCGELIYPNESFGTCDDVVLTIRNSTQYTERALQHALSILKINDSSGIIRKSLEEQGYSFVPSIDWCTPERMKELEENWLKHIDKNPQIQQSPTFQIRFSI